MQAPAPSDPEGISTEAYGLVNRKYLGSKRTLAPAILDAILGDHGRPEALLDGFCGTGAVAAEALGRGISRVVAVDSLFSNTVILQGFAFATRAANSPGAEGRLGRLVERLNGAPGRVGYITASYAGSYFSPDNCRLMDASRGLLEEWLASGEIDGGEHAYLLAGFLLGADRVANTVGQYDAFLKHLGSPSKVDGRHLVDDRVYSPFRVLPLRPLAGQCLEVLTGDVVQLAPSIMAQVAYLDPPYNRRQYCDLYHVLENLARWERPELAGKTRKPPREGLRSSFSRRGTVRDAFRALLGAVRAPRVFVSYNSEGIVPIDELEALLAEHGQVSVRRFAYPVFGSGAGVARKREVTEYLFGLDVSRGAR
jgi:adenine-specific DNA-methyltransferase